MRTGLGVDRLAQGLGLCSSRCAIGVFWVLIGLTGIHCSQAVEKAAQTAFRDMTVTVNSATLQLRRNRIPRLKLTMQIDNVDTRWVVVNRVKYSAQLNGSVLHSGELVREGEAYWVQGKNGLIVTASIPLDRPLVKTLVLEGLRGPFAQRELELSGRIWIHTPVGNSDHAFVSNKVNVDLRSLSLEIEFPPVFPFPFPSSVQPDLELDDDI